MDDVEEGAEPIDFVQLARQRARQVEPEPVDVHLLHPVAQAVHDELQHLRALHVQRVAAAGEVEVVALILGHEPVVRCVVDAAQRQRRPEVIALGGVVVDDVENDFEAGAVQRLDHALELAHRFVGAAAGRIADVRREERQRVVAPVVRQAAFDEMTVVRVMMHRHQLDRGDAEPLQMLERRLRRQRLVGAAQRGRQPLVQLGEALDVHLVDDRLVPRRPRRPVVAPRERRIDDHGERRKRGVVARVHREIGARVADPVAEHRVVPADRPADRLGVRIDDDLVGVETVAGGRVVWSVDPVTVQLARPDVGKVAMPHHVGVFGQRNRAGGRDGVRSVEQTELDAGRVGRIDREIDAEPGPGRPERVRLTRPHAHIDGLRIKSLPRGYAHGRYCS